MTSSRCGVPLETMKSNDAMPMMPNADAHVARRAFEFAAKLRGNVRHRNRAAEPERLLGRGRDPLPRQREMRAIRPEHAADGQALARKMFLEIATAAPA